MPHDEPDKCRGQGSESPLGPLVIAPIYYEDPNAVKDSFALGFCSYEPSWMKFHAPTLRRVKPKKSQPPRPLSPQRLALESAFGPSPLYLTLDQTANVVVYLDRELAQAAGISAGDPVALHFWTHSANRFALCRDDAGQEIQPVPGSDDLLVLRPDDPTTGPDHRSTPWDWLVFGPHDAGIPNLVEGNEQAGRLSVGFVLPNILPPPEHQSSPLVLTRGYRQTILNLDHDLAKAADFRPGQPLSFGYDSSQYPGQLLIFPTTHEVLGPFAFPVEGRWLHHRWDLGSFNSWFFPPAVTHVTPATRVGSYELAPDHRVKVLVLSLPPTSANLWPRIGYELPKPHHPVQDAEPENWFPGVKAAFEPDWCE